MMKIQPCPQGDEAAHFLTQLRVRASMVAVLRRSQLLPWGESGPAKACIQRRGGMVKGCT